MKYVQPTPRHVWSIEKMQWVLPHQQETQSSSMKWKIQHHININDEFGSQSSEWWAVTDGKGEYRCDTDREAQWLLAVLNNSSEAFPSGGTR